MTEAASSLNVFLDTMVYLHCKPIQEINFNEILGVREIKILVPRITLKELDKHKTTHKSSRTRERAKKVLSYLEKCIESNSPVRDGVEIEFISTIPRVDMDSLGLNKDWNDDLLIASIIEYKENYHSIDTILVTHDTGARLTCRQLGINTYQLPEKFHLAEELDESEKENQRLRKELQKIQNALPKITAGFSDDLSESRLFYLKPHQNVDEVYIKSELSKINDLFPKLSKKEKQPVNQPLYEVSIAIEISGFNNIDDKEFDRYNKERIKYFNDYEQYIRNNVELKNLMNRSIKFKIAVSNFGSAPAEDIDIHLHFPDGFNLIKMEGIPTSLEEPKPPIKPRSLIDMLKSHHFQSVLPLKFNPPLFNPPSSFKLRKTNSYEVTNHYARIKHNVTEYKYSRETDFRT